MQLMEYKKVTVSTCSCSWS